MPVDETESGFSLFWSTEAFHPDVETELLWIRSLNRDDSLLKARVAWRFAPNWRAAAGVDIFDGPTHGLFGRFDGTDRVYSELRFSF